MEFLNLTSFLESLPVATESENSMEEIVIEGIKIYIYIFINYLSFFFL